MSILRPDLRPDLEEEIRHHLEERTDQLLGEGWERESAFREAERRFGDAGRIRRELAAIHRDAGMGGGELVRSLAADARYAVRGLRSNPSFAAAVLLTLALGIGAASSIFAVVDAMLLRPLPYRDAERWVEVNQIRPDGGRNPNLASARMPIWRRLAAEIGDGALAYYGTTLVRTDGPVAEALSVVGVTPGAETLLGIPLLMGRGFTSEDARPGAPEVAVLSRGYYERIGADPEILGRTLSLESGPATVVGVLRGGIRFPVQGLDADLWIPIRDDFSMAGRPFRSVQAFWSRLRPGLDLAAAQERAEVLAAALDEEEPQPNPARVLLVPLDAHRANPDVRRALWILSGTVGAIFLIALVNGVNLVLVRASGRTREISVRFALGGGRRRIVRQLLIEGLVLGIGGGAVALAFAWGAVAAIRGMLPAEVVFFSPHAFTVEGRTLALVFAAAALAGTVLGLVPAVPLMRRDGLSLSLSGRSRDDNPGHRRVRNGLVIAQIALSMTLLAGAGLFVKSFARLVRVDPGFDHTQTAVAAMQLSPVRYADPARRALLVRDLEEILEARPGIEGVTFNTGIGFTFGAPLEAEGEPVTTGQDFLVPQTSVPPDYLEVMGIELVSGRAFEPADAGTDRVLVDLDLARFLWGQRSPVGRRFRQGEDGEWMTVVGVVRDLRLMGRDERDGPHQILRPASPDAISSYVEVWVRAADDPAGAPSLVREALRSLDPEQAIWKLLTASAMLAEQEEKPRFVVTLMSMLAGIAVVLASIGLYGVLAYSVARRDRELSIRVALGAGRAQLRVMVLREGLAVALLGVLVGLAGAWAASGAAASLLYEVGPRDGSTFIATAALLLGVAALACLLPAHRATRVDPLRALRAD